jgi:hypothetical protein
MGGDREGVRREARVTARSHFSCAVERHRNDEPLPGRGLYLLNPGFRRADDYPSAAATARFAITVMRCARYSAEA